LVEEAAKFSLWSNNINRKCKQSGIGYME